MVECVDIHAFLQKMYHNATIAPWSEPESQYTTTAKRRKIEFDDSGPEHDAIAAALTQFAQSPYCGVIKSSEKKWEGFEIIPWLQCADAASMHVNNQHNSHLIESASASIQDPNELFNCLVSSKNECKLSALGTQFILPRDSTFYVSDISKIDGILGHARGEFSRMVIDPPWENMSALRKKLYPTLPNFSLFKLPVKHLLSPSGAIVAIWCTNSKKFLDFVKRDLFNAWGVEYAATWYWIKVTRHGETVYPLDSTARLTWEPIIIGVANSPDIEKTIPQNKLICAVPAIHSRKPPLYEILEHYIQSNDEKYTGIELFARHLTSGWVAWGNESLRFQEIGGFVDKLL